MHADEHSMAALGGSEIVLGRLDLDDGLLDGSLHIVQEWSTHLDVDVCVVMVVCCLEMLFVR